MLKLLENLQKELEFKLKQLEAEPWEIEHILHLHGQKCCSLVSMEKPLDVSAADEFINAYMNQEAWVVHIPYFVYADMLYRECLNYYKAQKYSMSKIIYLLAVKPMEVMNSKL